jgi:hypothetical protein
MLTVRSAFAGQAISGLSLSMCLVSRLSPPIAMMVMLMLVILVPSSVALSSA